MRGYERRGEWESGERREQSKHRGERGNRNKDKRRSEGREGDRVRDRETMIKRQENE